MPLVTMRGGGATDPEAGTGFNSRILHTQLGFATKVPLGQTPIPSTMIRPWQLPQITMPSHLSAQEAKARWAIVIVRRKRKYPPSEHTQKSKYKSTKFYTTRLGPGSRQGGISTCFPKGPPQIKKAYLPGCLPETHADSAGPVPDWCQHQGKCSNRQPSAGHPLDSPEHREGSRKSRSVLGLVGPSLPICPPVCHARSLETSPYLASASPSCSQDAPMAATPSQPYGGLQLPGHGL